VNIGARRTYVKGILPELTLDGDEVKIVDERHYRLLPSEQLDPGAIREYGD
jgi:hypothetical protein